MTILIDNGEVFQGSLEDFQECFFSNADYASIKDWCDYNGYTFNLM